jgi:hypothetical protein
MTNIKKAAALCGGCLTVLLAGCSPTPLSDRQLDKIIEHCKSQGLAIYAFNGVFVSRAECISVTYKIDTDR